MSQAEDGPLNADFGGLRRGFDEMKRGTPQIPRKSIGRTWVIQHMEDPSIRERKAREYLVLQREIADRKKKAWAQPTKSYGFWTSGQANAKYTTNLDPGINKLVGRQQAVDT